jgi:hypothetical protein
MTRIAKFRTVVGSIKDDRLPWLLDVVASWYRIDLLAKVKWKIGVESELILWAALVAHKGFVRELQRSDTISFQRSTTSAYIDKISYRGRQQQSRFHGTTGAFFSPSRGTGRCARPAKPMFLAVPRPGVGSNTYFTGTGATLAKSRTMSAVSSAGPIPVCAGRIAGADDQ